MHVYYFGGCFLQLASFSRNIKEVNDSMFLRLLKLRDNILRNKEILIKSWDCRLGFKSLFFLQEQRQVALCFLQGRLRLVEDVEHVDLILFLII